MQTSGIKGMLCKLQARGGYSRGQYIAGLYRVECRAHLLAGMSMVYRVLHND